MDHNKSEVKLFNIDQPMMMIQNLGMWTFNTYLLDMIFIVKADMGKVTEKRIMILGSSCMVTVVIPYLLFGIVGYLSLGENVMNFDLFPDRTPIPNQTDNLMFIIKCLMTAVILIAYLMRFIALKVQLFSLAGRKITPGNNFVYTLILLFIPAAIGYIYPAVNDWIGLIGAFCMTTLGYTIPAMLAVKEMEMEANKKKWKIIMVKIWGLSWTIVGYVATLAIVLKMAHITG